MESLLTPTSNNQDEISKHLKKTKEDQKKYHDRHASKSMKERRQCTKVRMKPDSYSKPWRAAIVVRHHHRRRKKTTVVTDSIYEFAPPRNKR